MPHKINPIHFENAEGNLKIASDLFHSIGRNLMSSRLQRDLTDSTILRNVGSACGYMVLGLRNCLKGLERISLNVNVIDQDLMNNNIVLMEFIQLIMRKYNVPDAYNICKSFSRGRNSFTLTEFLSHLNKFEEQSLDQKIENPYWHISNGINYLGNMPISYNLILNLVSASGSNDPNLILDFVRKYVGNIDDKSLQFILKLIDGVINYYNDITKSSVSYKKPSAEELKIFEDLIKRLSAMTGAHSAEEIQTEIYQIGKDYNFTNLRDWFSLIYQVLFGKTEGPRFGSFVAIYGIDRTIQLIKDRAF